MFGPEVMIIGGNHNTCVPGKFMYDVHEKRHQDDLDIIIEDDVWIGSRSIILSGVRIGRGAIIGAGSVVTRNVMPYCVVAGSPAHVIKHRWTTEQALLHEKSLYSPEKRLIKEQLEHLTGLNIKAEG